MSDLRAYLETRRTVPSAKLGAPGPDDDQIQALLTIASRVPDHGKLAPWRFVVLKGDARAVAGRMVGEAYAGAHPDADPARLEKEARPFEPSPLVIAVVSTATEHPKIPIWEQQLAAGAVCLNLMHGAHALGFSAQWLTGWSCFNDAGKAVLGVDSAEQIAGFIHIGTPTEAPVERGRPDIAERTVVWSGEHAG